MAAALFLLESPDWTNFVRKSETCFDLLFELVSVYSRL